MSDDPSQPPPLNYWNAAQQPAIHPLLRILLVMVGMGVGCVLMGLLGLAVFGGAMHAAGDHASDVPLMIGILGALGFLVWLIYFIRNGRSLSIEQRTRGPRFFVLGILLGCGITILLQGMCFSAISNIG